MKLIDQAFGDISDQIGVPADPLKLLACLVLSILISFPIGFLRLNPILMNLISISTSSFFLFSILGLGLENVHVILDCFLTYFLLSRSIKNQSIKKSARVPWSIFLSLISHLTINHARRLFWSTDTDAIEITGVQMVLVIKLSTFAWNVYDGQRKDEELDGYQRLTAIRSLPSFLDFLGYCLFFPSVLVGPAIPYREYESFIYLHQNPSSINKAAPSTGNRILNSLKKFSIGIFFGAIVGAYGNVWSYQRIANGDLSDKSFLYRFLHVQASGFASRGKYYLAWSLAEASFTMLGYGYDYEAKDWKGGRNLEILEIELAQNYKSVFDNWNIKTNIWLRECIYKRVASQAKSKSGRPPKPGFKTLMTTFATSAAWHGPLPAYFWAFLSAGLLQAMGRSIRSTIRPFFLNRSSAVKMFYDLCCLIITQSSLNYLVVPFVLLDVKSTTKVYQSLYWYGHIMAIIPMLILWWPLGFEARLKKIHGSSPSSKKGDVSSATKDIIVNEHLQESINTLSNNNTATNTTNINGLTKRNSVGNERVLEKKKAGDDHQHHNRQRSNSQEIDSQSLGKIISFTNL